jgi:hypothetical protein
LIQIGQGLAHPKSQAKEEETEKINGLSKH